MGGWLGRAVTRRSGFILLAWIALAVAIKCVAPAWEDVTHDGDLAYLPATMPSVEGELLLARAFPDNRSKSEIAIVVERAHGGLQSDDLRFADALTDRFEAVRDELGIVDLWTRNTDIVGAKLTSPVTQNGQATVVLLHLANEFIATDNIRILERVQQIIAEQNAATPPPAGMNLGITGAAAVGGDMLTSAAQSIDNTELATVVLVVTILLCVYRAPLLVLLPLVTIGVSLVVATNTLALLTQVGTLPGFAWWNFKIFTTTKIFIVVILFGSGTDFCLFLIARYREELQTGEVPKHEAAGRALSHVSEALIGSALTTILGLGMMFFADFGKFRNSGPAIAICLFITLLACLTFAPAMLRLFGTSVFWPFAAPSPKDALHQAVRDETGLWSRMAAFVVARPGLVLVASLIVLTPFAWAGREIRVTYDFLNELDARCPSVQGTALASKHFPAGKTAPISVLAFLQNGEFDRKSGENNIARLTKLLYELPGVESVRSLAEPLGDKPGYFQPFSAQGLRKLAARKHSITQATFVTQVPELRGDVARFDVVIKPEPFSPAAIEVLERIDHALDTASDDATSPWHGAHFVAVGTTVGIRDLKLVTESDRLLIQRLVSIAVLGVLIVLLKRPLISLYLIASVLFSYYVTVGATQLAFAWWFGPTYQGLDWKVPIFLFVILVAVGEDYNIYLVTRVLEEQRRHGPLKGLQLATARTGGIITSCGVIMAGTFISMMTGNLRGMLELGFSLSLGVLLDTCMVRPLLVPAFMALCERVRPTMAVSIGRPVTSGS